MAEDTTLQDANARLAGVGAHFLCFDVTLHLWRGHCILRDAAVTLQDTVLDEEKVTRPQAILLPLIWQERLNKLRAKKAGLLGQYTLQHLAPGMACVFRTKLPEFMEKLHALQKEVVTLRTQLLDEWQNTIIPWNRERWGDIWEDRTVDGHRVHGLRHYLPDAATLQRRMRLSWSSFAVTAGTDAVEELSRQELTELAATTKEMTQERINQFVEGLIRAPRDRLLEAVTDVQAAIARGGKITESTFNKIRAALQLLREFQNIPACCDTLLYERTNELLRLTDNLPRATNANGEELRSLALNANTAVSSGLANMMSDVVTMCRDDSAVQRQMDNLATVGRRVLRV